jgi:hypothetical protein
MDRSRFLRSEYERITSAGVFVWSDWRDSFERFQADLWDMTPTAGINGRFLAPKDKSLGYTKDNVEWHYPRVRQPEQRTRAKARKTAKPALADGKTSAPKLTAAQKSAALQAQKQAKREALAAEFLRWNVQWQAVGRVG